MVQNQSESTSDTILNTLDQQALLSLLSLADPTENEGEYYHQSVSMQVLSQDLGSRMSVQRFLLHQGPSFSSSNPSRLGGKLVILGTELMTSKNQLINASIVRGQL